MLRPLLMTAAAAAPALCGYPIPRVLAAASGTDYSKPDVRLCRRGRTEHSFMHVAALLGNLIGIVGEEMMTVNRIIAVGVGHRRCCSVGTARASMESHPG